MSRESNNQPEASSANTFHSGGGSQSTAQGEQAIGTQINNYGPQVPIEVVLQLLKDNQPKPAPPAKTGPQTVVVDVWHRGDFATITDALNAVKPGARILVRPGVYEESLVLDKPVEIIGDGPRDEIVIEASGEYVVLFQATVGRLANLTLRHTGGGNWRCIDIAKGRLELEDCDISSRGGLACVAIHGSANATLRRNRIHDAHAIGVSIDNCQGTLEDNEIFANGVCGVEITRGGNSILRRNRISKNGWSAIILSSKGGGTFEENDLRGNARRVWTVLDSDCIALVQRRGNKE